jgi:hypothetical protein
MAQQSSTDFVFLVLLGLYLLAVSMISGHHSGNKSEVPGVMKWMAFHGVFAYYSPYGWRTRSNSTAKDVREDLLHVLQLSSP